MTNVILVMSDSLRADHLGCYGATDVRTPNLNKFAEESTVFNRAYIASYPTTPNRTDLWTGRYTFPFRGWQPLEPSDITIPLILRRHAITSHIVFDTPPILEDGFYRGFSSWWQIRGHHADPYITDPTIQIRLPAAPHKIKNVDRLKQYFRNRDSWRNEKDYLAPRTFMKASEWLERNRTLDRFFLMVDTWDPHEPFDPPPHYLELYADLDEDVENILYPQYGRWNYMTNSELQRVRALYAGEVTMVDTWMGMLLDTVERLGLDSNTLIIFTSDHGHLFGEHDLEGKPGGMLGKLYEVTTRIPLIIRHPDGFGSGQRIDGITQPPDILPTILEFFGIPLLKTLHGRSVLPLMTEEAGFIHRYAFSARFPGRRTEARAYDGWAGPTQPTSPVTITDEHWTLICDPDPSHSELYNLEADTNQNTNLIEEEPHISKGMRQAFVEFMQSVGAKQEWIAPFRLKLGSREHLAPGTTLHVLRHNLGKIFAYPTREEALACTSPDMDGKPVKVSFQSLLKDDPHAFVHIESQYYWAKDLQT